MEGHVWVIVESLLALVQPVGRRFRYGLQEILRVVVWAALHDRPMVWACQAENWPPALRPARLPHPSTISRRWRSSAVQAEAYRLHEVSVARLGVVSRYAAIDGRPLLVGGCSKDPDARCGRGAGGMGKGYKMHAVVDARHVILAYEIQPLNRAEQSVALHLLPKTPGTVTRVIGDGNYDSTKLHEVAAGTGKKLYTPLRENRVGRRRQPRRLRLLRLAQRDVGRRLLKARDEIERAFGRTTTIAFGYKGLPAWARRTHRVFRWMWAKNLIHHAWLLHKPRAA
jgi:hypothetical protein